MSSNLAPDAPRGSSAPGRALPLRNREFGRLWAARTLSSFGDGFTAVAFMIYATSVQASGLRMGVLFIAEIAPSFLSPLAGLLVDRGDRRRMMIGAELAQGLVMAALALTMPPFAVIVALAFLRAAIATALRPATTSAIPSFVDDATLPAANAWLRGGEEGANIVGPLMAGSLVPLFGLRVMFAVDAATFLLGALVLVGLPRFQPPPEGAEPDGLIGGTYAGLRYVARHPVARALTVCLFLFVFFAALENVPRPFLAQRDLGAGALGIGLLWSAAQLGMVLGLYAMSRFSRRIHLGALLVVGMALYGIGSLFTSASPTIVLAALGQLVSGIGNGLEVGCVDTILQRTIAKPVMGRVLANVYGAANIAAGIAYAVSGPLLDHSSARFIFTIVGAGCLFAALLTAILLPRKNLDREWIVS
jgi:MFS family permease